MRKLAPTVALTAAIPLLLMIAACDPAPPINTNEVDQGNLQVADCDANEVCP